MLFYRDLTLLQERQKKKCERLEAAVREDEALFFQKIHDLLGQNKVIDGTSADVLQGFQTIICKTRSLAYTLALKQ